MESNNSHNIQPSKNLKVLGGVVPDYSNPITIEAEKKVGPFTYETQSQDNTELITKGPIEFEDESIYIGEWNLNEERHGKGIRLWTDGVSMKAIQT